MLDMIVDTTAGSHREVETLSARERLVLAQVQRGLTVAAIAAELYISPNTVKTHLRRLYRKLGVSTRDEAIRAARALGLDREITRDSPGISPLTLRRMRCFDRVVACERRFLIPVARFDTGAASRLVTGGPTHCACWRAAAPAAHVRENATYTPPHFHGSAARTRRLTPASRARRRAASRSGRCRR